MTLWAAPRIRWRRCQVLGNEVQTLDCPRNGKRDKPLFTATALKAREGQWCLSRESGDRPGSLLNHF